MNNFRLLIWCFELDGLVVVVFVVCSWDFVEKSFYSVFFFCVYGGGLMKSVMFLFGLWVEIWFMLIIIMIVCYGLLILVFVGV